MNDNTMEAITIDGKKTKVVFDTLVFHYEMNARKHIELLKSKGVNMNGFFVTILQFPPDLMPKKYFGD